MKALVETTGAFMLYDMGTREEVSDARPSVLTQGQFLQVQVSIGQLRVLHAELPEEATDADWEAWLVECDGDVEFAIASYVAKLAEPPEEKPLTAKERKAQAKADAEAARLAALAV